MDPRIEQALTTLHAQYNGSISLSAVARSVNLSTSRFAHLFRQEVGASPHRYVRALRMTWARLLLERTSFSVKEVMARVGCNDPSHFTRDFSRLYGRTPSEWRARSRPRLEPNTELDTSQIAALANRKEDSPTR
jgi:AraC family transcriptional regulator of arabinose operon